MKNCRLLCWLYVRSRQLNDIHTHVNAYVLAVDINNYMYVLLYTLYRPIPSLTHLKNN